jgi:hypothetical protein
MRLSSIVCATATADRLRAFWSSVWNAMTSHPCMPCGPGQDALPAAAAASKTARRLGDRKGLGQGVDVDVSLAPAGFARRRDRAHAVLAHVRKRHWLPGIVPHDSGYRQSPILATRPPSDRVNTAAASPTRSVHVPLSRCAANEASNIFIIWASAPPPILASMNEMSATCRLRSSEFDGSDRTVPTSVG